VEKACAPGNGLGKMGKKIIFGGEKFSDRVPVKNMRFRGGQNRLFL
jgi:hypothetical protein